MQGLPAFSPRSDAPKRCDEPGKGDDVPCVKCGGALDTGLECTECGHDNYEAVTGKPFKQPNPHHTQAMRLGFFMEQQITLPTPADADADGEEDAFNADAYLTISSLSAVITDLRRALAPIQD